MADNVMGGVEDGSAAVTHDFQAASEEDQPGSVVWLYSANHFPRSSNNL
jgi:hypothetical protein